MDCSTPGSLSITNSWSLLKLMSIALLMPSNHLVLCCPLLLLPVSFSASGPFPMSLLIASGGRSIGASASTTVLAMNQFSSVIQSCLTLCYPRDCSMPGFPVTNSWSLLKLMSIESVMPSNHLILCHPLLLLPSIFPSIRDFSNESALC